MIDLVKKAQDLLDKSKNADFLAPLLLRLYLAPVFWFAGTSKMNSFESTVAWFGNSEWGLGLPLPGLMAFLATSSEVGGAVLLFFGLATRWICIPLMFTMLVAATTVHIQHGWQAVHDMMSPWASSNAGEALDRLSRAKSILEEHSNYDWLVEHGNIVMSNNGIEWSATYFIMLLALFFIGGGRFASVDYWIAKHFNK